MRVLFVDDSGHRRANPKSPYFCMGGFSVDGAHLKQLGHRLGALKRKWKLEPMPADEIKFNQIGRDHDTRRKPNPLVRLGYDLEARVAFGQDVLTTLTRVPGVKTFAVGVDRRQLRRGESAIEWAFLLLGERFEFSLNNEAERVGLIICDTEDVQDEMMRQAIYSGTAWTKLPNIAETVMFVPSHHSPGVQFADFVVGGASRWWNYRDDKYLATIKPTFYTDGAGKWRGCGIKSFRQSDYPDI